MCIAQQGRATKLMTQQKSVFSGGCAAATKVKNKRHCGTREEKAQLFTVLQGKLDMTH